MTWSTDHQCNTRFIPSLTYKLITRTEEPDFYATRTRPSLIDGAREESWPFRPITSNSSTLQLFRNSDLDCAQLLMIMKLALISAILLELLHFIAADPAPAIDFKTVPGVKPTAYNYCTKGFFKYVPKSGTVGQYNWRKDIIALPHSSYLYISAQSIIVPPH